MNSCEDLAEARGFPIRKSSDQSLFAAPRSISQRTTSFIASQHQGIHQMPLSRLIVLIINAHPWGSGRSAAADGCALKKDQLIVQDLPVGRGQAHGPRVACRSIDRYTDKSLLHDVNEPMRNALLNALRNCLGRRGGSPCIHNG